MSAKIPAPGKTTILVIIAIAAIALFVCYWSSDNIGAGLSTIKTSTGKLLDKDTGTLFTDPGVQPSIKKINSIFAGDNYVKSRPDLKKAFDNFVKDWKDSTRLTQTALTTNRPLLETQFKLAEEGYGSRVYNQLAAVAIDWFICMLALTLCIFSNILRDPVGNQSKLLGQNIVNEIRKRPPVQPPFSLSRTQLIVWIAIIGCVYVYAILWDGRNVVGINQTALILMGISAGTFTAGAILDTAEIDQGIPRTQDEPSCGFFKDILSDSKGISIHRFQNLVWTLIAIAIYFYLYSNPPKNTDDVLPILDNTILALTGISSATYLTLKTRENPPSPNVLPTVKLQLALSAATSAAINAIPTAAANINANGFSKAIVTISDELGNASHPIPDPAVPNYGFIASNVKPGAYSITVSWTDDTAPTPPSPAYTVTQKWQGPINSSTPTPITITL